MPRLVILLLALLSPLSAFAQTASSLAPRVRFETSLGDFVVEVDTVRAPLTAENFLRYVRDGAYDGTVFHRVIAHFVIQGGGYDEQLAERPGRAAIPNESGNGLSNRRGSLGLAREDSPHSGSSQFYVNLVDNAALDPRPNRWGYAVFGQSRRGHGSCRPHRLPADRNRRVVRCGRPDAEAGGTPRLCRRCSVSCPARDTASAAEGNEGG